MDATIKKNTKISQGLAKLKWENRAIDKLELTHGHLKGRLTIPFKTTGNLKGIHIRWNRKTGSKIFVLVAILKKKVFYHTCGEYDPKLFSVYECEQYVNELVKIHKNRLGWISNPNKENVDKDIIKESPELTIRECIARVTEAGYPRIKVDGNISKQSIREYTKYLFGYNKRREYLKFSEDSEGCGVVELTDGMTWERLFKL